MPRPGPFAPAFTSLSGALQISQAATSSYLIGPQIAFVLSAVNFNSANTDNAFTITLPTGYTRYLIAACRIFGASQTLTTATCGLFTGAGATGTAIVTSATAITVSTGSESTNANMQSLTINNSGTMSYTNSTLQFRVQTAQGAAATANVALVIGPLL